MNVEEFDSEEDIRRALMKRFRERLDEERTRAEDHPRNRISDWDSQRFERARVSAVITGWEIATARARSEEHGRGSGSPLAETWMVDVAGEIAGTPDLVERNGKEVLVVDYKTGVSSSEETKNRHRRQLLIYAHLVESAIGVLPSAGEIRYPGSSHKDRYQIDAEEVSQIVDDIVRLQDDISSGELESIAKPGQACDSCPYTLWCQPFWNWSDRSESSLEGEVIDIAVSADPRSIGRSKGWLALRTPKDNRDVRIASGPPELLGVSTGQSVRFVDLFQPEGATVIAGRFTDALILSGDV